MPRKIISFDCDGVLTPGGFVPLEDRTNKLYCQLNPQEDAIPSLHWLSTMYDIYIISQRNHDDSNLGLRAWLHWVLGLELDTIAGVITGPSSCSGERMFMDKVAITAALGCVAHFDDNPEQLMSMPCGILFPSDMPDSVAMSKTNAVPKVFGWDGVREFLTTPGFTLYSASRDIVSPAVVRVPDPKEGVMLQ